MLVFLIIGILVQHLEGFVIVNEEILNGLGTRGVDKRVMVETENNGDRNKVKLVKKVIDLLQKQIKPKSLEPNNYDMQAPKTSSYGSHNFRGREVVSAKDLWKKRNQQFGKLRKDHNLEQLNSNKKAKKLINLLCQMEKLLDLKISNLISKNSDFENNQWNTGSFHGDTLLKRYDNNKHLI